ncbi:MAG: MOSC N-terminal beta barrel domain-containing protein [Steroidobacteraceae bacterium]
MSISARIAALHYYPLKSARGIELERARLTIAGFEDDRRWMLVTNAGRFITQRELPRLALLRPSMSPTALVLAAPELPEISIPLPRQGQRRTVTVWRDHCEAFDEGDEVAAWLQGFLGRACRLVRFDPAHRRLCARAWTGEFEAENRFSDGFPILALNAASLADLNNRVAAQLPVNRFRPNIVLEGLQPYDEDRIDELCGDGVRLKLVKACTRCSITVTNQDSGEVEGDEPLRTLQSYRYDPHLHGVCFGQNAIVVDGAGATLRRGQTLQIRWREDPPR